MIIPKDNLRWLKVWKKPGLEATTNALSLYLDWAFDKQWMSILTDKVFEEAEKKGKYLSSIITSLRHSKYLVKGNVSKMDKSYSEEIDKVSITYPINEIIILCFSYFLKK